MTDMRLGHARYGKAGVRLLSVRREGATHHVRELTVQVSCEGDFAESYHSSDNHRVLPTDTMKNTVYALARRQPVEGLEAFAESLGREFLGECPWLTLVLIEVVGHPWQRVRGESGPHPHAFVGGGGETATVTARLTREGASFTSGLDGLELMKTTASGFEGYPRTRYTTLSPTQDRILRTVVRGEWTWKSRPLDFDPANAAVRDALIEAFVGEYSPSVQYTLKRMAEAALERVRELASIRLTLPNRHCLLVDLEPFGLDNPNQVFVVTGEPYGLIEATFTRS
jgi:urate oxidase